MRTEAPISDLPMRAALDAVEIAEQEATGSREAATFHVDGRVARNADPPSVFDVSRLADPLARRPPTGQPTGSMHASSRSAIVVLGKFAHATQVKARAYLEDDGPLTLKVWTHGDGEPPLGRRERRIRLHVRRIAEYRAPEVVSSGVVDNTDYLLERVVFGQHPRTREQRFAAAEDLLETLSRAYLKHGLEERALSEVVHAEFPERVEQVIDSPHLPWLPEWGSRRRMARRLVRLVNRDRAMTCSLGHGDLVATNIIRDAQGRHILIDWEHGRFMPVAFDLGKLHITSGDPASLDRRMQHALKPFTDRGRRHYRWREQLALGICHRLSFLPARQERANKAGRASQLEAEIGEQVSWLAALLSR